MDDDMDNPVNSVMWKPEYFGNGIGDVVSGPAAGWATDQGNLERNYGQESRLFSKTQIRSVLSRCELQVQIHWIGCLLYFSTLNFSTDQYILQIQQAKSWYII